jgi:hypothetical protein
MSSKILTFKSRSIVQGILTVNWRLSTNYGNLIITIRLIAADLELWLIIYDHIINGKSEKIIALARQSLSLMNPETYGSWNIFISAHLDIKQVATSLYNHKTIVFYYLSVINLCCNLYGTTPNTVHITKLYDLCSSRIIYRYVKGD